MTNRNEFRAAIAHAGMSMGSLADQIGISRVALSNKVNNKTDFTTSEITAIEKILKLTPEEKEKIFFAN